MITKIMIIQPNIFVYGGAERQIVELANYLTDHNCKVTIMTVSAVPDFISNLKEARVFCTGDLRKLVEYVRSYAPRFTVVNSHNHPAELFLFPIKHRHIWQCNEPPIQALRGGRINPKERDIVNRFVDKVFVISDYDKGRFEKLYGFTPIVNYPGVRYSMFADYKPNNLKKGKDLIISQFGYFTWTKNQVTTVQIFSKIHKDFKNTKLLLVGYTGDQYYKEVLEEIKRLKLEDNVIIKDYIESDEELRDLYYKTDVFVNPVLDQGGYATTFEAIASGVPTIVSDKFIASSICKEYSLARVCKIKDFEATLRSVLQNLEKEKKRTIKNRIWIKNNLTWKNFGKKYLEVIEDLK